MKKYTLKYLDKSGDLNSIIVFGDTKDEAKEKAKREYWDISEIIQVTETK